MQDQIYPRARRQRGQPREQMERLELEMHGPVCPRAVQGQADVTGCKQFARPGAEGRTGGVVPGGSAGMRARPSGCGGRRRWWA